VECSSNLSTPDLEAEIFLHVLQHCIEYVQAEGDPNPRSAAAVAFADGDGMTRWVLCLVVLLCFLECARASHPLC
jgi:hypothetical protein